VYFANNYLLMAQENTEEMAEKTEFFVYYPGLINKKSA
jgi:hypothetical protein